MGKTEKAVVLLSGGLDSATAGAIAKDMGFALYCLTVDYGQRHRVEIRLAAKMAKFLGAKEHKIMSVDLRQVGGSALTDFIEVPKDEVRDVIPVTYVPARNTIFLALALGWAEVLDAAEIFIGVNAVDYSGYPDCRPEFINAFERLANLATRRAVLGKPVKIMAPLINMSKAEIIKKGAELGVDFSLTSSCYDPGEQGQACGLCHSCRIRQKGFAEAGILDPIK